MILQWNFIGLETLPKTQTGSCVCTTQLSLTSCQRQVVWKSFRSSVESEYLLLELYSPYRPQHRTQLVVPWLHGDFFKPRPSTGHICKAIWSIEPWFFGALPLRCWIWWQRPWPTSPTSRSGFGSWLWKLPTTSLAGQVARMDTANNYVPPEFGLKDLAQAFASRKNAMHSE